MRTRLALLVRGDRPLPELASLAATLETRGFEALWHANHAFERDVWVSLAHCAAHTRRIRLGAGVVDPLSRHPALTAAAAATLDEASGGRAVLGLGAGSSAYTRLGFKRSAPRLRLAEAIQLTRALWAGETVQFEGRSVVAHGGPLRGAPRKINIFVGTRGPAIYELAGELADGVLLSTAVTAPAIRWALERIAIGARRAGRDPAEVEVWLRPDVSIAADEALARDAVREMVFASLRSNYPGLEFFRAAGVGIPQPVDAALAGRTGGGPGLLTDELIDSLAIAGSLAKVERALADVAPLVHGRIAACAWPVAGQSLTEFATTLGAIVANPVV
jgi:5,10-methylenetetrahydromethanopterin reductase